MLLLLHMTFNHLLHYQEATLVSGINFGLFRSTDETVEIWQAARTMISEKFAIGVQSSGAKLYAVLRRDSDMQVFNNASRQFEVYDSGSLAEYAVNLAEQGSSGVYVGDVPSKARGEYPLAIFVYRRNGQTPVEVPVDTYLGAVYHGEEPTALIPVRRPLGTENIS